jgi:4-hydroxy-tetrahydrodipicolinate synthase
MPDYTRAEARDWAQQTLTGVHNVIIPTFTADLTKINEAAVRHDVRRELELGFTGCLLVSETATSLEEYVEFVRVAADEAAGRLCLIHHASFNTLEENIVQANRAAEAGAQMALLSYPPTFYPTAVNQIADYTRAFCAAVDLAVMLFPVPLWGFERLHPASIPITVLEDLVDTQPTVVAIKAEGGHPSISGFTEVWRRLNERVVVTMPIEAQAIPLATILPIKYIGTSNTECLGNTVPRMLALTQRGAADEAMELFWSVDPARRANDRIEAIGGANTVNRMAWKYLAWLNGFNGGPIRMPIQRIVGSQMRTLRSALAQAGLDITQDDDGKFFIGRNPA